MKNQSQNSTVEITNTNQLLNQAIQLVRDARQFVVRQTNSVMVFTYFQLGRLIVEQKQGGKVRAAYGKDTIQLLSKRLTSEFGNGFSADNLENMRKFFLAFQNKNRLLISETVSRKLDSEQIPFHTPENPTVGGL